MTFIAVNIEDKEGAQSIHIPNNLRINDEKVYLKKVGDILYLIPFHHPWQSLLDSVSEFTPDFMEDRGEQDQQTRESLG